MIKIIKIFYISLLCIVGLLAVVFFAGPRVSIDTTIYAHELPQDLDKYLAESEAKFNDIVPNTEKTILWAGDKGVKTAYSLVYFHGFSATRQEVAPLTKTVAQQLGANVYYPRFKGHGRSNDAMLEGSVNGWLNDASEAMAIGRRLGEKVIVVGVSTGGTLATWLASTDTDNLAALILMSPNFAPADERSNILTWPWGGAIAEVIIGPERSWEPLNDEQEKYWTYTYPTPAVLPMMGLVKLVNELDLAAIQTPTFVIYSPNDQVVNPIATDVAFEMFGSAQKQKVSYTEAEDPSQHVLAGDIVSPASTQIIADLILAFIRN